MLLWYLGNLVLVVVAVVVVLLANRVITFAREAARYADDVLDHGVGLSGTLDPVPALAETAELSARVAAAVTASVGASPRPDSTPDPGRTA